MHYEDFFITVLSKGGDSYDIEIASPAGEGKSTLTLPRSAEETMSQLRSVRRVVRGSSSAQPEQEADAAQRGAGPLHEANEQPTDVGRELFEALFNGAARSLFDQSLGMMRGGDSGLRIKLRIDPANEDVAWLAQLPWELLYRAETRDYLNLSRSTPLVRYLDVQRPSKPLPFHPPLKVLVVMSSPEGVAGLDLERERSLIDKSWGRAEGVEVEFLTDATVQMLSEKLAGGDYHVVHFMGHGDFNSRSGSGVLLFEDEKGGADPVEGRTLGVMLRDETSVRLVFLNACDTAKLTQEEGQDPFAGVATALVMAGVPAVVAMQFPVSDVAAIEFAGCFYSRIVQGFPVDAAVAEGRKAVRISDADSLEWATPVLFMRSADGVLFEAAPTPTRVTEAAPAAAPSEAVAEAVTQSRAGTGGASSGKKALWAGAAIVALLAGTLLVKNWSTDPAAESALLTADEGGGATAGAAPGEPTSTAPSVPSEQAATTPPAAVSARTQIAEDLHHGSSLLPDSMRPRLRSDDFDLVSLEGPDPFASLAPDGVLVISMAYTQGGVKADFTPDEIQRLRQHLEGGGGVLLAGLGWVWTQYENRPCDAYPFNVLAEPYGIYFACDSVRDKTTDTSPRFTSAFMRSGHPAIANVRKLFIAKRITSSLVLSGSAVALVRGDDNTVGGDGRPNPVIIAAVDVGPGRLMAVQHMEFLSDHNSENDGAELLTSALAWLAHRS